MLSLYKPHIERGQLADEADKFHQTESRKMENYDQEQLTIDLFKLQKKTPELTRVPEVFSKTLNLLCLVKSTWKKR